MPEPYFGIAECRKCCGGRLEPRLGVTSPASSFLTIQTPNRQVVKTQTFGRAFTGLIIRPLHKVPHQAS